MIKKISYAAFALVLVLFTVGFFRYNPTVNYKETIPTTAKSMVRVNLRELEFSVLKSFLKHPFSFFEKSRKDEKSNSKASLLDAIEIPTDLFFYTESSDLNSSWFSNELFIKSIDELKTYFQEQHISEEKNKDICYYKTPKVLYLIADNKLTLVLNYHKRELLELLALFSESKEYLSENDVLINQVKGRNALVTIASKDGVKGKLYAADNALEISGNLGLLGDFFEASTCVKANDALISVQGKFNVSEIQKYTKEAQKEKFKKLTSIPSDSLLKYWNGKIDLKLASIKEVKDTIVTYEYDDDFNKIEKKSVQNSIEPQMLLSLGGLELHDYLEEGQFIKSIKEETIFIVNPFFKTLAKPHEGCVSLYTGEMLDFSKAATEDSMKFQLTVKINEILKKISSIYTAEDSQMNKVEEFCFKVKTTNDFSMKIKFIETSKGPIAEIISLF